MKVRETLLNGWESLTDNDATILRKAARILERRLESKEIYSFSSHVDVAEYLKVKLGMEDREVFCVLYLSPQNRLLAFEVPFAGTHVQCSVHMREVLKRALELKASAVILSHNHPSGAIVPSEADKNLTAVAKTALAHIDVKVLDHIIVGGNKSFSFAEYGIL